MNDASKVTPELLLDNLGWLRALAHSLVRDSERAEDLVQETLVVALESPPNRPKAVRAWLRTVARNRLHRGHRGRVRRLEREQTVAREKVAEPSVEESVERAELQRKLVDSVFQLQEPYRKLTQQAQCAG